MAYDLLARICIFAGIVLAIMVFHLLPSRLTPGW